MNRYSNFLFSAGLYFVYISCFFLPLSTALLSATTITLVVFYFISGEFLKLPALLRNWPIALPPLLLFTMLIIGLFYSEAGFTESILIFKKYRNLAYFPIILSFLISAIKKKGDYSPVQYAKMSFIAGATTLMCISFAMYLGWLPSVKYGHSTIHHIPHSFFMAMLGFWALQYALNPPGAATKRWQIRTGFGALFLLACTNLFFVAPGRTGMAVLMVLVILSFFQLLKPRNRVLAIMLAAVVIFGIYKSSDNFSFQVNRVVKDLKTYKPGAGTSRSSLGMRFDWWLNSVNMIKEKPFLGHGTGSFRTVQYKMVKGTKTVLSDNPHNEYLMMGVQLGVVGIALFLLLLVSLFLYSYKLPKEDKNLLQGSVLAFAWGCVVNSFLFDSFPSHYFMMISAVLCSSRRSLLPPADGEKSELR